MPFLRVVALVLAAGCTGSLKGADAGVDDASPGVDASGPPADGSASMGDGGEPPRRDAGPGCVPVTETCDGTDEDCDGLVDEGVIRACGETTGRCRAGTEACEAGTWGACEGAVGPRAERCDGADDDCDGSVDEGLDTDHGTFAGCGNFRWLLDTAIATLDDNVTSGGGRYIPRDGEELPQIVDAAMGTAARAELYRATQGVRVGGGGRLRMIEQAMEQADAFLGYEATTTLVSGWRSAAGISHACRGIVSSEASPTVTTYTNGAVMYAIVVLARALYADPPDPAADHRAKARAYLDAVGPILTHWIDGPHFFAASASDGRENWMCENERASSCTDGSQRLVKWNKQTFLWRATGIYEETLRQQGLTTSTWRTVRAMRFARFMKKDMLETSAPWSDSKPYVWHAWADHTQTYPYIEDASHGAWDVGLMAEAWAEDWREEDGSALMGTGSASRFRRTYLDNLAIAGSPCVGRFVDGSHEDPSHRYYGLTVSPGRRRALSEWIGVGNGDESFLLELQEDMTGACEGFDPIRTDYMKPGGALALVRLFIEAQAMR